MIYQKIYHHTPQYIGSKFHIYEPE